MRTCEVDGCERRREVSRGWCLMHYKRWKRTGDPVSILRVSREEIGCTVAECGLPHTALGMCRKHYYRWRKHGDPAVVGSTAPGPRRACAVEGCPDPLNGGGYCNKHGKRAKRWGDPLALGYGQVDADTPTVVYLIENEALGALKVGVGVESRLRKWRQRGWRVIASPLTPRRDEAQQVERSVLAAWDDMGLPRPFLARGRIADGYTETVPTSAAALAVARRIIEEQP